MTTAHLPWFRHASGITTIDAGYVRPGFASVHVLERSGRVAIIDTGTSFSVPLVMKALEELGLQANAVDLLFLTHVHLDHAGGAGQLLERLPGARVLVHPRGAAHLIDPTRLESATMAVYGEHAFRQLYGALAPIPEPRVHRTQDGERLRLGSSDLVVFHTPGHALHHQVLFDPSARAVFAGDTFGVAYPELATAAGAFIVPTTTPTQFDPEQLLASIRRIDELDVDSVYLTHFGRVTNVDSLASALREQVEHFVTVARTHAHDDARHDAIRSALRDYVVARAEAHGVTNAKARIAEVLGPDLELNTQGLVAWLSRVQKQTRD